MPRLVFDSMPIPIADGWPRRGREIDDGTLEAAAGGGEADPGANKLWTLKRINLLRAMPSDGLQELRRRARPLHLHRRQLVFGPTDRGDAVYLIEEGRVKLSRFDASGREITLAILDEGELFGEEALTGQERRRAAAEALTEARLLRVASADFERILQKDSRISLMVARQMSERLLGAQDRLASLALRDVTQRVAEALLALAEDSGDEQPDGSVRIRARLTHQELAALVASTRETVTASLGRFRREGWITTDGGEWIVRDRDALRTAATEQP